MAVENQLVHIDVVVVDGQSLAFEDSTGIISGAAGFKNDPKLSASGTDFTYRSRVARMLRAKLQWSGRDDPKKYSSMSNVQITMRDTFTGKKCIANKATFGEIGDIGGGTVDITFHLLEELQWL